jgi:tetratricopeptide (TPR) repeat protein
VSGASAAQSAAATEAAAKGYKALAGGHPEEAIIQYTQAIDSRELDPSDLAMALLNRALARQGLKQMTQAIDDYSAAMRVDALSPQMRAVALYNRGLAYQALQKRPQAIEDFTSALYLDSNLPQAYHARGNALRESGQYLFALSDYAKARRFNHPQPHVPVYGEALTYEALGRPAEARKALEEAVALKPDFAPARERLAQLDAAGVVAGTAPAPQPVVAGSEPAFTPVTSGRDPVVTGAIGGPDQTVTKLGMPEAVAPPASLFAGAAPIPQTVTHAPPVPEIPPAPAATAAAQPQAQVEVQVAALEPAGAAQASQSDASNAAAVEQPAAAEPQAQTPQADPEGWAVQVSSQRDEQAAWNVWKKLQARHGKLLGNSEAVVVRADLGTKGVFYRLRINALPGQQDAAALCARLKRAGTSCFVTAAGA